MKMKSCYGKQKIRESIHKQYKCLQYIFTDNKNKAPVIKLKQSHIKEFENFNINEIDYVVGIQR